MKSAFIPKWEMSIEGKYVLTTSVVLVLRIGRLSIIHFVWYKTRWLQSVVKNLCLVTNRAPMQWSDGRFAGFTTGNSTWIEVSDDYHSVNVEVTRQRYVTSVTLWWPPTFWTSPISLNRST